MTFQLGRHTLLYRVHRHPASRAPPGGGGVTVLFGFGFPFLLLVLAGLLVAHILLGLRSR